MAEQRQLSNDPVLRFDPSRDEWQRVLNDNLGRVAAWDFAVGGHPVQRLRSDARSQLLEKARGFSAVNGIEFRGGHSSTAPVVMTGHQPDLFHPGVWIKYFALQRFAEDAGATAIDIVVDSDAAEVVALKAPCFSPSPRQCIVPLGGGEVHGCYACTPVPSEAEVATFREEADALLGELHAPSIAENFGVFVGHLAGAAKTSANLAVALTKARRGLEGEGSVYGELPVSYMATSEAYLRFVAHILLDAARFAHDLNEALHEYRLANKTRSKAQPFPDLRVDVAGVEAPFWLLTGGGREVLFARETLDGVTLTAGGGWSVTLPRDIELAVAALSGAQVTIVPKAVTLTMFVRMFCADLFIHGTGGGRYDQVTDDVCEKFFGVTPPSFVVASADFRLPLDAGEVDERALSDAKEELNRLAHNPDVFLAQAGLAADEHFAARGLVDRKTELVARINDADADKKAIGIEIKEINRSLAAMLEPLREQTTARVAELEAALVRYEVATDRSYSYFLWSPSELSSAISGLDARG